LGTTGGIPAGGGGYFTGLRGRTEELLYSWHIRAMVMEFFFHQGSAGRDSVDSVDIVFNTTTSATSVMSKTNGEVKISGNCICIFSGSEHHNIFKCITVASELCLMQG
jgi:hypothetical protein